jgi:molybdate transport system substrate-binding protein
MNKILLNHSLTALTIMISALNVQADEIKVMSSVAFKEPYLKMAAEFEKKGHVITTTWLPTVEIVKHIKAEDAGDLVIIDSKSIDSLIAQGKLKAASKVNYVSSGIGIGVAKGATRPVVRNKEDLYNLLITTKSLAYSTGPSGAYLASLFEQMGVSEQIKSKTKVIQGEPVGNAVKRGEVEIAFQQIPEILSVPEIDFVGPLPEDVQYITTFAFAIPSSIPTSSPSTPVVQELIQWLKSARGSADMRAHGLEPY